jgi:hypothetical protein
MTEPTTLEQRRRELGFEPTLCARCGEPILPGAPAHSEPSLPWYRNGVLVSLVCWHPGCWAAEQRATTTNGAQR